MNRFFFFLCCVSFLFANPIVTENDPSSLVNGVSVISGDFFSFRIDYEVQGAESVKMPRAYLSSVGEWHPYPHLIATSQIMLNQIVVQEPNGTGLEYKLCQNPKPSKKGPFRYDVNPSNIPGLSNTASGTISAHTNFKNQFIVMGKGGHSFILYAANGTKRFYQEMKRQKPTDMGMGGKQFIQYYYYLASEELPNGKKILYSWDDYNRLLGISSVTWKHRYLASVGLKEFDPDHKRGEYKARGSDGQSLTYTLEYLDRKKKIQCIKSVDSPHYPNESYTRTIRKERPRLETVSLDTGKILHIEYEEPSDCQHPRVKRLLSPVGKDDQLCVLNTFEYHPDQRNTDVFDAIGNKTSYHWNSDYRLTHIDFYEGTSTLHHSEQFVWDAMLLRAKTFLDEKKKPVFARVFQYDDQGNIQEEILYGNLSGSGISLQLGENGFPIENGVQKSIKKTEYTNDGRNLPIREEQPNGLVTLYTYVPNTHLVQTKTLCDGPVSKIHYRYDYDDEFFLIRETIDDGISKTIRKITPSNTEPYIGMPDTVEELYEQDGKEILLGKNVFTYGTGARIVKKDVYDSTGSLRYSIHSTYDHKGRLVSETNPLGWESKTTYNASGHKEYTQDAQSNETHYAHDLCHRLRKKEIIGFDGIHSCFEYEYDLKHDLILEIDAHGQKITHTPTPFGQRAETRLPPDVNEEGIWTSGIFKSSFDALGNAICSTSQRGYTTERRFNAYGKPIWIKHPDGGEETFTYDLDGELRSYTDATGVVTEYERDYLKRIISKTIYQEKEILAKETYQFAGQFLISKTDAEHHTTLYSYDRAGRKISEELDGEKILFYYDALSRCHTAEKGEIKTISHFDLLGRTLQEEVQNAASGQTLRRTSYTYDRAGNKIDVCKTVGETEVHETAEYDSKKRLKWRIDGEGAQETNVYNDAFINELGQTVSQKTHTDPLGLKTVETLNIFGQIARVVISKETTLLATEKKYNLLDKPSLQIDTVYAPDRSSKQIKTRWEYDSSDRLAKCIEAETKTTTHTYTLRGEKQTTTKPDGVLLQYEYNGLGHLASITSSDGTVAHHMRCNRLGQLTWSDGIERRVDAHGRVLSESFPSGYSIQNNYNSSGQRKSCAIPIADCLIEYNYDGPNLTLVSRNTFAGAPLYHHRYAKHDLCGNPLLSELPGNLGYISFQYDQNGRQTSVTAPSFEQAVLKADLLGNIHTMRTQQTISTFTYDALYQLTSESGLFNHTYTFDSNKNRLQKDRETYTINSLNQLTSHIEYDPNGNPKRQGDTLYTFDALDRLIRIETPDLTQQYTYDSQHRRLTATDETTKYFLYDGQNEIGSFDENRAIQELRILGATQHAEIAASISIEQRKSYPFWTAQFWGYGTSESPYDIYIPIHDLSGNIAALLPLTGGPVEETRYSAFGEELGSTLSPWRYSSKRVDDTGLVYYGRRFYQPDLGRWLSPDPAGFTDGMNLYAFVSNCPLTHFDEYGLLMDYSGLQSEMRTAEAFRRARSGDPAYAPFPRSQVLPPIYSDSKLPMGFYFNGILNTPETCREGATQIGKTLNGRLNITPVFSESKGVFKDGLSVFSVVNNPNYSSRSTHLADRCLRSAADAHIQSRNAGGKPPAVPVFAFSRGAGELYHTIKNFTNEQKSTLDIISCGGIMMIPRGFGRNTANLISKGDWCCLHFHPELKKNPKAYDSWADVYILDQIDGFSGFNRDHFILSETYQKGIASQFEEFKLSKASNQ